jgi:hypothetical protein
VTCETFVPVGCLLQHKVKPLCSGVRIVIILSYPEDGGSRFPRNLWRQFTELYGVTYQEPYLASQRVFIARTKDCRHCSVNSTCVLERGSGLTER